MTNSILQVRDIPDQVIERLRERAAGQGISLSAYVRNLLAADAEQMSMSEAIAQIAERAPVDVEDEDIIAAIHEGRR
jgi:plasmid stability protein